MAASTWIAKSAASSSTVDHTPLSRGIPEALPADGLSRWNDLMPFIPFSRETARKRELEGRFPKRKHLSKRCAVWSNRSIHQWIEDPVNYRAHA